MTLRGVGWVLHSGLFCCVLSFFFSSRRRHTRCLSDWSSDVCSSDLCYAWRRRYPLACFGLFLTLILLAPTSSIVPILDPLVERRMYLPLIGLILIGCEIARHIRVRPFTGYAVCGAILAMFYVLCYQRNLLWAEP